MSPSNQQAGANIRRLAARRKFKATIAFSTAIFSVIGSIILHQVFQDFTRQLLTITSTTTRVDPPDFSLMFYGLGFIIAASFTVQGLDLWKRAKHAEQGAEGEEAIAQDLTSLIQEGWQFEYGRMLGKGLGDADIIGRSPKGHMYVIDVKSHGGEVGVKGDRLYRRYGAKTYSFEKDFLAQVMKQAYQVKDLEKAKFVTPIVVFSQAKVTVQPNKIRGTYVVERSHLIPLLKKLG